MLASSTVSSCAGWIFEKCEGRILSSSIYGAVLIYVVSVKSVVIIFYKILSIEVSMTILSVHKKSTIWLMDRIGFMHPAGKWNNIEVKVMSHSWTDTWLEISFTEKNISHICANWCCQWTLQGKKNCSSNEFFILSNLTLLLVCGLEANKYPNCIV